MGRTKAGGFIFVQYETDHPPDHVHIFDSQNRFVGRCDIEHQRPMDRFHVSRRLREALRAAGHLKETP